MRATPNEIHRVLSNLLSQPEFDRVDWAEALVRLGLAQAVVVADLGKDTADECITRSLVVQAANPNMAQGLLGRFARDVLKGLNRPASRYINTVGLLPSDKGFELVPNVREEARMLVAHGDQVLTYVGVYRSDCSAMPRAWAQILAELSPQLCEGLRKTATPLCDVKGALVLDAQGRLMASDVETRLWLDENNRIQKLPVVLRVGREDNRVCGPLDGARVQLRAAQGDASCAWIGTIQGVRPLRRSADSLLTPSQRQVAELAVMGSTCAQISKKLGTSVETVRTHVRGIYQRLNISTRAELASIWLSQSSSAAQGQPQPRHADSMAS